MNFKHISSIFRKGVLVFLSGVVVFLSVPGNASASNWGQYSDEYWAFTLEYPTDWVIQNNPYRDFGWRISMPESSFDPLGRPSKGGYISIVVLPQSDKIVDETEGLFGETITSINQITISNVSATETNGTDQNGNTFKRIVFIKDNYSYQINVVLADVTDSILTTIERILNSFEITGVPVEYPHENLFSEVQSLALNFPSVKHAFQIGSGKISNSYGSGLHTGGDAYALDLIECNGSANNLCGQGTTSQYVIAPTDIKLIWSGSYNGISTDANDFHIFEVTYDLDQRLCMSLAHFYIEHPQLTTNKKVPRGTVIGRLSSYPASSPHVHMGLWTTPISNGCAAVGSRTAVAYTGAFSLDGIEYPAGQNHAGTSVNSTNSPICAEATSDISSLSLSDCWGNGNDNAAFVTDVTIPDGTTMNPGQSFTKTWRMKNTGNTTWGSGYSWVFTSGSQLGAPSSVSVPSTSPNNTADLSVNMTAPGSGGSYTGYWRMKNPQGQFFGDSVWVRITVNSPPPSGNWQAKYAEGDSCWWDTNCGQFNGTAVPKCEENISGAELHKIWGTAAPCGGMNGDNWVGNFVSTINFPSGNYVFHVNHDDGAKFWLNGNSREFGGSGTDIICNGSSGFSLSGNQSLRVMLREQGGDARISVSWSNDTSVCNPPGEFSKSNPSNFINWQPTSVTLSWDPSDRAASYEYCYDTTNNNSCDGSWIGTGTNRSKTISGLSRGTTYYWQVRARNSGGIKEANYGSWWSFTTQSNQPLPNILYNGGFEEGYIIEPWGYPYGWYETAWKMENSTFGWDTTQKHSGNRSVKISNTISNDARWTTTVWVQSNADYRLSGWIKTANIAQNGDRGANLSILDTWISTDKLYGTNDWTFVSVDFNTESREYIQVAARVGMYSGTINGTAWFDDLKLELLSAPSCYTLTTNSFPAIGGNVSVVTPPNCNNGVQYVHGTIVAFTTTPNPGYTFAHWNGANPTFETPARAFIVENKHVTAYFSSGSDTTGVFRPSNGLLYLKNQNTTGFANIAINYGVGGDYPVVGDWDGDGDSTIGIYRNGSFYLRNANTVGFANLVFAFGQPGDQPVAGDWNGDGVDTIGVYRPSTGQFLLRNSNSAGAAQMSFYLGNVGDVGIAGDWNGDGVDTTGVFRPSNGVIFLKNANTTGYADIALNYGLPGDRPVTGDWNNDGIDTIGVYRNGQFLLRNLNTVGFADIVFGLGNPGDMPIAGNWDGLP